MRKGKTIFLSVILALSITLTLIPALAAEPEYVAILTVNDEGEPITGVDLLIVSDPSVYYEEGNPGIQMTTSAPKTVLKLHSQEYWIYAEKRGVGRATKTLEIYGGETVELTLNPLVKGIWTDPITGKKHENPATPEEYPNWPSNFPTAEEMDFQASTDSTSYGGASIQGGIPPRPRWFLKDQQWNPSVTGFKKTDDPIGAIYSCANLDVDLTLRLWESEEFKRQVNGGPVTVVAYTTIEETSTTTIATTSNGAAYNLWRYERWVYNYYRYGYYRYGRWYDMGQWKNEWQLHAIGDISREGPATGGYDWHIYNNIVTSPDEPYKIRDFIYSEIHGSYLDYGLAVNWYGSWHEGGASWLNLLGYSAKSTNQGGSTTMYRCRLNGAGHYVSVYEAWSTAGTWVLWFYLEY